MFYYELEQSDRIARLNSQWPKDKVWADPETGDKMKELDTEEIVQVTPWRSRRDNILLNRRDF